MNPYEMLLQDLGNQQSAPPGPGLLNQINADLSAPDAPPVAAPTQSWLQRAAAEVPRQLGLTARAGLTGVTALPNMLWNGPAEAVNWAAGKQVIPTADSTKTADYVGLPQPQNAMERIAQDTASGMASAGGSIGLGKALMAYGAPMISTIGQGLQSLPGMQIVSSGTGAGSAGGARELGVTPGWQLAAGLVGGGLGALASSGVTAGARKLGDVYDNMTAAPLTPEAAAQRAQMGFRNAADEVGTNSRMFTPRDVESITPSIIPQVQENPTADVPSIVRKQDFRNLGIQGTTGQITRNPTQYAEELNMRGAKVGDTAANPLAMRFNQQNAQIRRVLEDTVGSPSQSYEAGSTLSSTLGSLDNSMRGEVTAAYNAARQSSGKNLDIPLAGVAQKYGEILNDFGDKIPAAVRNNFEQYGLMSGTQNKTFTFDNAESLLKNINQHVGNDPVTNTALGNLRSAVKDAILSADDQGGVFAGARDLAAKRFALHEQIPALQAAFEGRIAPDDFISRFITKGKTDDVKALATLLKESNPEVFTELKAQLGSKLYRSAFGADAAGDKGFLPNAYKNALDSIGDAKLSAFFKPEEIDRLHTVGRVGAYMNSYPSGAPVNTSNTASALGAMLSDGLKKIPVVSGMIDNARNRSFINDALAGALARRQQPVPSYAPDAMAAALLRTPSLYQPRN